jgi:DNA polymerase I-like protein with 3'-5' exonuclease and polymerase domains
MINYLIQGSAADCTKQAMINYDSLSISQDCPMILQVHDELLLTAPKKLVRASHNKLAQCLAAVDFAVPMLSDGKTGYYSWDEMRVHRD